jgi:RNA polymerase sigma-70 factor, ECF subfamily
MAESAVVSIERRRAREIAFADLVARELAAAYRTAAVLLGDHHEAEDATQDALVRAWRSWSTLRDPEKAGAWFGRILINTCRDRLRARRRPVRWVGTEAVEAIFEHGEREAMWQAIGDLTPDHRIVIVLRYYLDLPIGAIAERTGVPVGTVKSRLHHALVAVRAAYEAQARASKES